MTLDPNPACMTGLAFEDVCILIQGLTAFLPSEEELRKLFWGRTNDLWQMAEALGAFHKDFVYHEEKDEILRTGLEVSSYVNVDDTGARHAGKNGYCTHIGNEWFAWFQSSEHKNRINFLELLRTGHTDYIIDADAIEYMQTQGLPKAPLRLLVSHEKKAFGNKAEWEAHLNVLSITNSRHVRITTEGALIGSILNHGVSKQLVIVSDDAGQFDVLLHALCWIHAERTINKIIPFNDQQRVALEEMRTEIWQLYADLKSYKAEPAEEKKAELQERFDTIFGAKTPFATLNEALKRLHNNKAELLLVLERPESPLHNNTSEGDIREYVKKRKISGGTRSTPGQRCRDTFASLKKTCRKLGITFWDYLNDRASKSNLIPPLSQRIRERANSP
ncbi:MAG: transposase [Deltaproteobacteria bacterium]|nr:transposase [Deltaproteobacteria bacterium]